MMKLVVLSCILAAAAGSLISPLGISPLGLSPLVISPIALTAGLSNGAPWLAASNYRGPLSLAPGQPANIIAADGRPLDTLDVNLDRAAHITAQALDGSRARLLKKRSISPLITPLAVNRVGLNGVAVAPSPLIAPLGVNRVVLAPSPLIAPLGSPALLRSSIVTGPLSYVNAPIIG